MHHPNSTKDQPKDARHMLHVIWPNMALYLILGWRIRDIRCLLVHFITRLLRTTITTNIY